MHQLLALRKANDQHDHGMMNEQYTSPYLIVVRESLAKAKVLMIPFESSHFLEQP